MEIKIKFGTGIKKVHISRFTRQFATMIGAGLPMVQCLDILATQSENKELCKVISDVKEGVEGGSTCPIRWPGTLKFSTSCTPTWSRPVKWACLG